MGKHLQLNIRSKSASYVSFDEYLSHFFPCLVCDMFSFSLVHSVFVAKLTSNKSYHPARNSLVSLFVVIATLCLIYDYNL